LNAALADRAVGETVEIVHRERNLYASTFSSEFVSCRVSGGEGDPPRGREVSTLVKGGRAYLDPHTGHKRGVPYEIEAYRWILPALPVASPKVLGSFQESGPDAMGWLCLERLTDAVRIDEIGDRAALRKGAQELAALHAEGRALVGRPDLHSLNRYHGTYLEAWGRRWVESAGRLGHGRPWIRHVAPRIDQIMDLLNGPDLTVVHGEAYPSNILLRADRALIVDWESVGIGSGELDLATLLLNWPEDDICDAERAYVRTRWPSGAPRGFERVLSGARFHALGQLLHHELRHPAAHAERVEWILAETESTGERLGFL
jgi:hypothetical protein